MQTVVLIAMFGGALFQIFIKSIARTAFLGFLGFVAYSVYLEFFVPYRGGGASLWPLDIVFAVPCAAFGAGLGACAVSALQRKRHT